jgi:hypothetical protein
MPRKCQKEEKQQSMADGSADLDGFPVSEGETLNATCVANWFRLKEGWLRPLHLFNYILLSRSILMC